MAICRKCGHSNDDNAKFCGGCGARLDIRQSTPPPLVFDLEPDEDTPKSDEKANPHVEKPKQEHTQPRHAHKVAEPPSHETRPNSQSSDFKPRMMHSERKSSPGTLSKSCMLSGCLTLLVIFLICGGILAYLMYQDDEKESRSILNSIETPEGIANVEGISGVSLSEDGEASSENAKEGLPIGKEYINKDLEIKIGFSKSEAQDGGEPVYIMYYVDDTQDYEMVEIQPSGKGHYTIFKSDGMTPDGELYIYPGAKKIQLKNKGVDVIFNIADNSSEDN